MDANDEALAGVAPLGLDQEIAAVHKGEAPALPRRLGGVGRAEDSRGVVGVAGHPAGAAHALDAAAQRRTLGGALGGPGAVQGDEVVAAGDKVEAEGGRLVQGEGLFPRVFVDGAAGDEVLGLVDRIAQLHLQAELVPQGDAKGLDAVPVPEHGQPRQGGLALLHPGRDEQEVGRFAAVGILRQAGRGAVIRRAGGRELLGQKIGPAAGVAVGRAAVRKVRRAVRQAGAVVGVQQHPAGARRQLVAGVGGVQGITGSVLYDHGRSSSWSVSDGSDSKGSMGSGGLRPACSSFLKAGRISAAIPSAVTLPPARAIGSRK